MTLQNNIPKKIHYCWFGGNSLPPKAIKCINSWKKFFPDYEIIEWNEQNFDVNKYEYTKNAYAAKKYAFVSDMARLFVLSQYGGIYFDTDVEVIRPFEDILEIGGYLGIEVHKKQFYVNPGLGFACVEGSPVIGGIFDVYKNQIFDETKLKDCNIVTITTAFLLEKGLKKVNEIQKIDDITVYPQDFFNPRDMSTGKLNLTSNTRSIHHFSASWVDRENLLRGKIYRFINRHFGNNVATLVRKIFGRRKK